jgi:hypothetical protein
MTPMPAMLMPRPIHPHREEAAQRPSRRTHLRPATLTAVALASVVLLAGCDEFNIGFGGNSRHSTASDWVKPGAEPGETSSAYRDCAAIAQQATQKDADIDQDIAATRDSDLQHSQIVQMRASQEQDVTAGDSDSILASCMRQKGFVGR